jgi:hypothetical protein
MGMKLSNMDEKIIFAPTENEMVFFVLLAGCVIMMLGDVLFAQRGTPKIKRKLPTHGNFHAKPTPLIKRKDTQPPPPPKPRVIIDPRQSD